MNDFNGRTSIADLHAARVSLLKQQRKSERQLLREERDTLVEWVNKKLGSQHTVSSLTVDFASGVLFARLLLQLCADAGVEDEPGPFDLAPKTGIQKLDNIVTLFAFLRDQGCEMPEDVSPNAIVSKQKRAAQKLLHVLREFEEGGGLRRFAMRASRGGVVRTRGGLNRRADSVAGAGVRRDSLYPTSLAAAAVFLPAPDEESPMALSPIELTPDASPRASEPHTPRPDNAAGAEADVGEGSMTIPSDVEDGSPVVGKRRHKRGATLVIGFNVSASLAPPKSADTREALAPSDQETTSDESTDESPRARRSTRHLADLVDPSEAKELRKKRREQAKRRRDKKAERDASSRRHYDDIAAEVFGDGDAAAASDGDSDSDFGGSVPARRVKDDRANLRGHYGDIENEIFGGAVAEEPEQEADEDSDFGAPAVRKIKDERQNLRGHYADLEAELFGDDQQEQADEDSDFGAPAIKVKDERENLRGHYADLEAELFGDGEETQSPPPKPVVPDLTPQPPRQPPPEPKPSTTIITTTEPSDSDSDSGRDVPAGEPQVGLLVTQPDSREPSDSLRAGSIILTAERAELPNHPNMVPDDSDVEVDRGLAAVPLASAEAVARAKRLARGEEVEEDKKPHAKRLASQGSSTSRLIQQMKRSQIDLITARSGQESSTPANREPDSPLRTRAPHAAPVVTIDSDDESTPHRMARSTSAPDISDAELSPKNATSSQNATPAMVRSQSVSTSLTAEEAASQQQSPPRRKGPKTSKKIQALLYGKKQNKLLDRLGVDEAELKRFRDKPKAYKLMGVAEDSHGHEEPGGSDAADAGDASSVTSSGSSGGGGGKKSKKTASRDAQVLQYEVEESRMIIGDLREQLTVLKERLERRDAALDELQHDIALGPQTSQSMDEEATAIRRRYRTLGMQMAPKPDTLSMMGVHLNKALWSILQEVRGRQGHLMKRRPFNRVFTRWRTRFFELRGSRLIYWENEFHQHEHFRGCLDLTLFKKPQLVQKGDTKSEDENIIRFFPRDAEDATPSPRGGSSNSLSPVDLKSDGGSAETLRWLASIKQRLHLIDYLEKCDANRETGCKEIVHFLLHERADTLRLDRCTDIMIFAAFQHFMTVLQAKETLLYLSLAHVNLSARTLESLGNVIAASSSIKYVNLQHNGITATSVRRFTSSLLINESVEELCLDDNQLQDDGVKLVAELVGQHKTLRLVGLRNNNIGPAGVAHLAAGLTSGKDQKPCFPVIDLGYNRVGDEGCAALVDACCNNPSIEVLDLQHNRITDAGCEVLAAAIRDPASNLKELMLAGNSITSAGVEMLATALQETPSRSTLSIDLSHNPQIAHGGLASLLGVDSQLSMPLLKVARYTPS